MKRVSFVILCIVNLVILSFCQSTIISDSNETYKEAFTMHNSGELTSMDNLANITQDGNKQIAKIIQINGCSKNGNHAGIVQNGVENNASIEQNGEGNTNIIVQKGSNNKGVQKTEGDQNYVVLEQNGINNRSIQILSGDNLSNIIIQHGRDNNIVRQETGSAGLNYRITQDGNGMRMTIVNGR